MYLRLGKTQIKYQNTKDNFIILAEIVDSMMGYESPVLVQSLDELDIWFGDNFTDREYIQELLKTNPDLSILLSFPFNPEKQVDDIEGWIDLGSYIIDQGVYYSEDQFPTIGKEGIIYRVRKDISGKVYEDWIWTGEFYIPVKDLPQENLPDESISYLNRDTLRLGWKKNKEKGWVWCSPKVKELEGSPQGEESFEWEEIDLEKIDQGEETLAFSLTLPNEDTYQTEGNYLILGEKIYYTGPIIPISNSYYKSAIQVRSNEALILRIEEDGWKYKEGIIQRNKGTKVTYFYKWDTLSLEPDMNTTQDIISSQVEPVISFWSKTLGRCREEVWDEDNISVTIEQVPQSKTHWRITISRYDYSEVYEGTLYPSDERIDFLIEKNSKLTHCSIPDELSPSLTELPTGTWQLRRSRAIKEKPGSYEYTLEKIFRDDRNYYPDFFLIPDLSQFVDLELLYPKLVSISKQYSLQFLIQNSPKDFKQNYIQDDENRLVWFMDPIVYMGNQRPGYYLFLSGLLQDIYSLTSQYILYPLSNITTNPYSEELSSEEVLLKKYKSNYLVCNNQTYYYREYQEGTDFKTSIWMRWVMGKISRELEKNKGEIIGSLSVGEVIEKIEQILGKIKNRFSIIRIISISDYNVSFREQKISLEIDTTISDLKQDSMTLDINLIYNKTYGN